MENDFRPCRMGCMWDLPSQGEGPQFSASRGRAHWEQGGKFDQFRHTVSSGNRRAASHRPSERMLDRRLSFQKAQRIHRRAARSDSLGPRSIGIRRGDRRAAAAKDSSSDGKSVLVPERGAGVWVRREFPFAGEEPVPPRPVGVLSPTFMRPKDNAETYVKPSFWRG